MPVLVFSGKLRKNQKAPLVWVNDRRHYNNASKLIDAIFAVARGEVKIERDKHVYHHPDRRPKITKIKWAQR